MRRDNSPTRQGMLLGERLSWQQAEDLNALMRTHLRSRRLFTGNPPNNATSFKHPWKTSVTRNSYQTWKVTVRPGTINDTLALYTYKKQGDPRGWKMPNGYVPALDHGKNSPYVDRSPFEQVDPPFLLVTAPDASGTPLGDFIPCAGRARPKFFSGLINPGVTTLGRVGLQKSGFSEDISLWPLYRASVVVSATPYRSSRNFTFYDRSFTTQLKTYRMFAGRLPQRTDNVEAGGFCELAQLYLLRNPNAPVLGDQLYVKQIRYWCMQAIVVQPSLNLGKVEDAFNYGSLIGGALAGLDGGASFLFGAALGEIAGMTLDAAQQALNTTQSIEFFTA